MNRWLVAARAWLYTNGTDNGDQITISFERGGESLAKFLEDAYNEGRKDERGAGPSADVIMNVDRSANSTIEFMQTMTDDEASVVDELSQLDLDPEIAKQTVSEIQATTSLPSFGRKTRE